MLWVLILNLLTFCHYTISITSPIRTCLERCNSYDVECLEHTIYFSYTHYIFSFLCHLPILTTHNFSFGILNPIAQKCVRSWILYLLTWEGCRYHNLSKQRIPYYCIFLVKWLLDIRCIIDWCANMSTKI